MPDQLSIKRFRCAGVLLVPNKKMGSIAAAGKKVLPMNANLPI